MYILLGKSQILRKLISLGLFLLQDAAGATAFVGEYPEYSSDSGPKRLQTLTRKGISQKLGLIAQSSSEIAKFSIPAQEIPKSLGQSLCHCTLIKKLIKIFVATFQLDRDTQDDNWSKLQVFLVLYICKFSSAGNSCKFLHNILYCSVDHISTIVKYL